MICWCHMLDCGTAGRPTTPGLQRGSRWSIQRCFVRERRDPVRGLLLPASPPLTVTDTTSPATANFPFAAWSSASTPPACVVLCPLHAFCVAASQQFLCPPSPLDSSEPAHIQGQAGQGHRSWWCALRGDTPSLVAVFNLMRLPQPYHTTGPTIRLRSTGI